MQQQRIMVEALQSFAKNQAPQTVSQTPPLPAKEEKINTLVAPKCEEIDDQNGNGNDDNKKGNAVQSKEEETLITPKQEPHQDPIQITPKVIKKHKSRSLKRTLSYEQAFKAGKRQQKTVKERMLRKMLNARLTSLEDKLMRGYFHDEDDKFKLDDFYETVSPIVYSVTGAPDECNDEELPGKCAAGRRRARLTFCLAPSWWSRCFAAASHSCACRASMKPLNRFGLSEDTFCQSAYPPPQEGGSATA